MEQKCTSWSSSCQRQCPGRTPRWKGGCPPLQAPCQHWGCWKEEIVNNNQMKKGRTNKPETNKQTNQKQTNKPKTNKHTENKQTNKHIDKQQQVGVRKSSQTNKQSIKQNKQTTTCASQQQQLQQVPSSFEAPSSSSRGISPADFGCFIHWSIAS